MKKLIAVFHSNEFYSFCIDFSEVSFISSSTGSGLDEGINHIEIHLKNGTTADVIGEFALVSAFWIVYKNMKEDHEAVSLNASWDDVKYLAKQSKTNLNLEILRNYPQEV